MNRLRVALICFTLAAMVLWALVSDARADHLYTDTAGFTSLPATVDVDLWPHADRWNQLAPEPLFTLDPATSRVEVVAADVTWVDEGPEVCTIRLAPGDEKWLPHELGHCLGYADHIPGDDGRPHVNPATCPDGYVGIMSYCHGALTFADDDLRMVDPGYRRVAAIVVYGPDALPAATIGDVLYVTYDTVPQVTRDRLYAYDAAVIVGGTSVISWAVQAELERLLPTVRIAGAGRAETAAAVSEVNETIRLMEP